MASDFDCSIDYLVNEAMRYYARSKNYQTAMAPGSQSAAQPQPPPPAYGHGGAPAAQPPAMAAGPPPSQPPPYGYGQGQPMGAQMPGHGPPAGRPENPPAPMGGPRRAQPSPQAPAPAASPSHMGYSQSGATLYLLYQNQRYPITKDQFIIGRGSKTSDLPIKDGNISRKHAAVIRRNGTFYIKDLGSTNGIDYKGMRIDNKRIDEGDVFHLCDYELRFTYQT